MTGTGKWLLWLTAMTTASMTLTACDGAHADRGAMKAGSATTSTTVPYPATTTAHPHRPRPPHITVPGSTTPPSPEDVAEAAATARPLQPFTLVVSDGSDIVQVGDRAVQFSTTVTDATVSPNGRDLAFVDRLGNIALAHLDGSGLRVLTSLDPGVRRAQPTFEDGGSEVVFSERGSDGVWRLKEVAADGHDDLTAGRTDPTVEETASDGGQDTAPSATWFQASHDGTARSVLLFEHRTARGVTKVYVADRNQRGFGAYALLDGRAPAVSPSGDRFAFLGPDGQVEVQALPVETRRPHPTTITAGAHPTGHLAWSPDGRRVLFSTRHDVESVSSDPVGRLERARLVSAHPGVPAVATLTPPTVGVYAATDAVSTSLTVSHARFVDGTAIPDSEIGADGIAWATHVTLLSTRDPDAAAAAAAVAAGGPILFLPGGRLDPRVRDEVMRLLQQPRGYRIGATVDIVGTTDDVPTSVDSEIRGLGGLHVRVRRFTPDAAAVAAAVAVPRGSHDTYVVVSKDDLPAIASATGAGHPVLLTDGTTMPSATAARLDRIAHWVDAPATVYAVGHDAQVAVRSSWPGKRPFVVVDLGGTDPAADSLAAVQALYDAPGRLSVAPAADWRSVLIATMAGPALVVDQQPSAAAQEHLAAGEAVLRAVYVFGGSPDLPRTVGDEAYGGHAVVRRSPEDIPE